MFIGNVERPRALKKKFGQEYGLDYHSNKKAWMKAKLFFSWLQRFNAYIYRDFNRKVILLVDNCAANGSADTLPILSNVIVKFLVPNTTSKVQPCYAGIIAAMKVRYRMFQMERAIDLTETNTKQIFHTDI